MAAQEDDAPITLDVSILGRDYRVACRASEQSDLLQAVDLLDGRMREIRDAGKIAGAERIAVMAALNMANELLRQRVGSAGSKHGDADASNDGDTFDSASVARRISAMQAAIDRAMAD